MKRAAIGFICLISVIFAFSLQAAPAQDEALFLPLVLDGSGGDLSLAIDLESVVGAGVLQRPVDIANAGDGRLFVVERAGTIRVVEPDGTVLPEPFLDIRDRVEWESHGERGLLGLAFHPDYATNGAFFVNYTAKPDGGIHRSHISRFRVSGNPDVALGNSEELILAVDQPFANHNGGDLAFGADDGYLYVALGDGGSSNDPGNRALALDELLGKILRLDVDATPGNPPPDCGEGPYRVPADNPFAGQQSPGCGEIWAYGLRNPWRFSFDVETKQIFIADVGQSDWEEINVQPIAGGRNYGWSCYEGTHRNGNSNMPFCPPASTYTGPVFEYDHGDGCSVTGGFVYRGQDYPALVGHYLFTDFCSGIFWDMAPDGTVTRHENLRANGYSTFGVGADGELYVANLTTGELSRVTATAR